MLFKHKCTNTFVSALQEIFANRNDEDVVTVKDMKDLIQKLDLIENPPMDEVEKRLMEW